MVRPRSQVFPSPRDPQVPVASRRRPVSVMVGDLGEWHTVMPTSLSAIERLTPSQLEEYERQILQDWEKSLHYWSGIGKHPPEDLAEAKKLHNRFKLALDTPLGSGGFGVVQKVQYNHNNRSICLARKHIRPRGKMTVQDLRREANVMEKLDHDHIVKLVGTYCVRSNLYLLLWPVAVCNLDSLLNDIDCLRSGHGDREDIISRLHALDLKDLSAIERTRGAARTTPTQNGCPLKYLQHIVGCITRAVAYCHQADVRHLDLKPSNILLNPGRVYLADFGISRDVHGQDHTMTRDLMGTSKWKAPERHQVDYDWSMGTADVYSLGMVLLGMATVMYREPLDAFEAVLGEPSPMTKAEKLKDYSGKLENSALATQEVEDPSAPTFGPKHIVHLVSKMVSADPNARPSIFQVDSELAELGGIDQVYHSSCCKRSSRFMTERMNNRLKLLAEERDRLRDGFGDLEKRLKVLEEKDLTYELRIMNERKAQAENIAKLQANLEKERNERKRLEELVAEMQQQQHNKRPLRPGIPRPHSGRTVSGGSHNTDGVSQTRPMNQPLPTARPQPLPTPPTQQPVPPSAAVQGSRLSYSQTARAAIALHAASPLPATAATRRDSAIRAPIRTPTLPSPAPVPNGSPSPDTVGYPLHSRTSSSRLPRPIHPATPIRSSTPVFNRDTSSSDSTQYSRSSSIFSPLTLSKHSIAATSVAGTPVMASPALNLNQQEKDSRQQHIAEADPDRHATVTPSRRPSEASSSGIGLGFVKIEMNGRRGSVAREGHGEHDAASVISSALAPSGTRSPVNSGSALSSPRSTFASADGKRASVVVPSLPTAPSWADVARR